MHIFDAKKTIYSMTLADICGEDNSTMLSKNPSFGYDLYIENENCECVLDDKGIHPYAIESLALFCRQFLASYETNSKEHL